MEGISRGRGTAGHCSSAGGRAIPAPTLDATSAGGEHHEFLFFFSLCGGQQFCWWQFRRCLGNSHSRTKHSRVGSCEYTVADGHGAGSQKLQVDIYTLPSQSRVETVKPGQGNGMVMSLALFHHAGALTLAAGFENGSASVHLRQADGTWTMTYRSQVHTQPVLSLAVDASHQYFLTSAADAIIAKNPIPTKQQEILPPISAEEQVVEVRDDGSDSVFGASLLSSDLRESSSTPQTRRTARKPWEHPLKVVNTKHSGQQGLQIRSDGRIFVTAGWDSNLRVFSCKTLQELAVLGWHKAGCYAAAFADICTEWVPESLSSTSDAGAHPSSRQLSSSATMMSVQDRRILQAKTAHWVAAGAKDGKVSLWEIY